MSDPSKPAETKDPRVDAALRELRVLLRKALEKVDEITFLIGEVDSLDHRHTVVKKRKWGWILCGVLAFGLVVFGVMTDVVVIYLNGTAVKIDVTDPNVVVAIRGTTLTITGPDQQSVKVVPGDQELTITCAGLETKTKSFTIKRGETKTVTVSIVNKEVVARLENEILPLTPAHEVKR
ncbi:MAG TPA: hypothetical protein VMR25_25245 [Planctomycetaceae bacterium]|nr:hypothetical protein [Planctomycetaceae bacterium]